MYNSADLALVKEFKASIRTQDTAILANLLDSILESLAQPTGPRHSITTLQAVLPLLRRKPDLLKSVLLAEPYEKRLQRLTLSDTLPAREVAEWLKRDKSMIARINWRLPGSIAILQHYCPAEDSGFWEHVSAIAQENSQQALALQKACYTRFVSLFAEAWPHASRARSHVALHEFIGRLSLPWRTRLVFRAWISGEDHDYRVMATLSELGFLAEPEFRREFGKLREQSWTSKEVGDHESRIVRVVPDEKRDVWRFSDAAARYLSSFRCCSILCNEGLLSRAALDEWDMSLLHEIVTCNRLDAFLSGTDESSYHDLHEIPREELLEMISAFDRHLSEGYEDMWDQLPFRLGERPHILGLRLKQIGFDLDTAMPQTAKIMGHLPTT